MNVIFLILMAEKANHFYFGERGTHEAWTEGEDIVHIRWRGDVRKEDIGDGAKAFELASGREKGLMLVMHVAEQGKMGSDARTAITNDPRSCWIQNVFVVGASFHVRVVLGMVSKALHALGVGKAPNWFVRPEELYEKIEAARRMRK